MLILPSISIYFIENKRALNPRDYWTFVSTWLRAILIYVQIYQFACPLDGHDFPLLDLRFDPPVAAGGQQYPPWTYTPLFFLFFFSFYYAPFLSLTEGILLDELHKWGELNDLTTLTNAQNWLLHDQIALPKFFPLQYASVPVRLQLQPWQYVQLSRLNHGRPKQWLRIQNSTNLLPARRVIKEGDKNFNLQRKKKQKIWILLGLLNPSIGPTYRISIAQSHCAQQIFIWPNFPPIGSDDLIIGFVTCKNIYDKTFQNLRQQRGKGCDF